VLTVTVAVGLRGGPVEAEETPAHRRARIERMDAERKQRLRKAQGQFEALDPAEQEELRELSRKIEAHPQADQLLTVMERYCEWLSTLSVYERDELRELPPAEKIEKIKELRARKANRRKGWAGGRGRFGGERLWKLASQEEAALGRWIDQYAGRNLPKLLEALPEPGRQELLDELQRVEDDPNARRKLFARLWMRWQLAEPGRPMPIEESALEQLQSELSAEIRESLEKFRPEARRFFVRSLIGTFVFLHSQEELSEHLQNELTPEERDRLTTLPPEEARRLLWWHYVRSKLPDGVPPFSGHHRPGWRPGGFFGRPSGGPSGPRGGFDRRKRPPGGPPGSGSKPGAASRRPAMRGPREGFDPGPEGSPPD
jgi:hypothetical protein